MPVRFKNKTVQNATGNARKIARCDLNQDRERATIAETARPSIAVKLNSKKVFDKMFSRTATASSFRWSHLINALTDAGMVATQSTGSGVKFNNEQGSIVIRSPHGKNHDSTLSVEFLRGEVGKRLKKWFAWDCETFVERSRDE